MYFCWKNVKSYSHFFSKNVGIYPIFNDQRFNDTLTNNIISFEQLGPEVLDISADSGMDMFKPQDKYCKELCPNTNTFDSLSRIPGDSLKLFEISVPRHTRVAEVKKTINWTTTFNKYIYVIGLLKLEIYWKYCGKEEKLLLRSNFSSFPQYFVTRS